MKKFLASIVATLLSCIFLFAVVGCAGNISFITDIERFSDMQKQADKIDVDFDNATKEGFEFAITDENEIAEIMEIIFSETLTNDHDPYFASPNDTSIMIYQGEKTYSLGVRYIDENSARYYFRFYFSTSRLEKKITELATARGAFDSVEKDDAPSNGGEKDDVPPSGVEKTTIKLDAKVKQEIIDAYVAAYPYYKNKEDVFPICYGEFNGTYVLIIFYGDTVNDVFHTLTVDGITFYFGGGYTFSVYREGDFFTLQEAFVNGLLTHENLLTVRENYQGDSFEEFEENEYKLTVQDPRGYIIEALQETYKAGEKVTVKTEVLFDVDMIAYLDGVSLGRQTAVLEDDEYHWEFYFVMPAHDAVLNFELSGGM